MSREIITGSDKIYYSVFDGAFRRKVRENTEGAMERINKLGKQVFEVEVDQLAGIIENIHTEPSDYGEQIKITLDANADGKHPVLSFGMESKDGRDVLRKLPALDFSKEVVFAPYKFQPDDSDAPRSGLSIYQDGEKVENHFFDTATKTFKHGFPTIDWDKATKSQQKVYQIERDEFLQNYFREHVLSKFTEGARELPRRKEAPNSDPDAIDKAFEDAFPDKAPF